jgi:sec-independent protein translocase protein TatC
MDEPAPITVRPARAHPAEMTLGEHLEDLRRRLILALLGVLPIFIASLAFGRPLLAFLIEPLRDELRAASQPSGLLATGPFETFAVYLQISFIATVLLGSPWLLYQLWMFIAPGLYTKERRFVHILVPLSTILTLTSAAFLYLVVLPVILAFFISFGTQLGQSTTPTVEPPPGVVFPEVPVLEGDPPNPTPGQLWVNTDTMQFRTAIPTRGGELAVIGAELVAGAGITQQYRVSEYVKTLLNLALAFGIGFQTPVVVLLLGWAGIVDRAWLTRYRRQAIAICTVAGAVLTPADPLSMILLAIPLYALFELGMVLLVVFPASHTKKEPADAGDDEPPASPETDGDAP